MFGSHLSIAGGIHNALLSAEKLGMETVQVFTKNQKQWSCAPLAEDASQAWAKESRRLKMKRTVSHDSYLINLANADDLIWQKSIELFIDEVSRCDALSIPYLVTHPGAHLGTGEAAGLARVAAALDIVHARLPKSRTITCLEITAGQGTSLGYTLEHLAEIMNAVDAPKRLGVCLDTAHLFAAGYDFRGRKYRSFRKRLDALIGVKRVKVLHLNDSKKALGSRVDRHDHIGRGEIGIDGFRPFVRDPDFANIPKILETPKGLDGQGRDWDAINLDTLRGLL
ncbi:MAG: deoxyribonuclease IV [Phycisphaerae bacterium]|nr:deoxyribonuclease IV [Phycisphaerae bacterium]